MPEAPKKKRSYRKFDEVQAEDILYRLANGDSLTSICADFGMKPATVYMWTRSNKEFARRFEDARNFGDAVLEDTALDIADNKLEDWEQTESESSDGSTRYSKTTYDNVQRSKLQAETRLKIVARRKGGKITAEIRRVNKREEEQAAEMSDEMLLKIAGLQIDDDEANAGNDSGGEAGT